MIAIFGKETDVHIRCVAQDLKAAGAKYQIIDTSNLASRGSFAFTTSGKSSILDVAGNYVCLPDIETIWMRRQPDVELHKDIHRPLDQRFCRQEWGHALDGMLLDADCRFVNPLSADFLAVKPFQLREAQRVGLSVPDTLITNDAKCALEFIAKHGRNVIHKCITAPRHGFLRTKLWSKQEVEFLDLLKDAPVIFQELISGGVDIRVTFIGGELFPVSIEMPNGGEVDSRLDLDFKHSPYTLSDKISASLICLMESLGLLYGTIDLRIDNKGEVFFLEVNPQGQFLYIEILTGLPLTATMARFLINP